MFNDIKENFKKVMNAITDNQPEAVSTSSKAFSTAVDKMELELKNKESEIETLNKKNENLRDEISIKIDELENIKDQIVNKDSKINNLEDQLDQLNVSNKELTNRLDEKVVSLTHSESVLEKPKTAREAWDRRIISE